MTRGSAQTALRIDASDPTPPYEQVRRQLAFAITSGAVRAGDRLPTVRQLAGDLGVAAGTVMRAYAELEAAGLVSSRRGAGTVVESVHHSPVDRLALLAHGYVEACRAAGADDATALAAVRAALAGAE